MDARPALAIRYFSKWEDKDWMGVETQNNIGCLEICGDGAELRLRVGVLFSRWGQ